MASLNVSCLANELYQQYDQRRTSGFSWLYSAGNLGALLSAILCGWVAYVTKSWHVGFALASFFLLCGILFFLSGRKYFNHTRSVNMKILNNKMYIFSNKYWMMAMLLLVILFFVLLLQHQIAVYLLIIIGIISAFFLIKIISHCTSDERKRVVYICIFTLFATVFWVFDQQNGSSLILYIQRNVDRHLFGITIPTAVFQSVNSGSVIIGGFFVAWLWRVLANAKINVPSLIKLSMGNLLLTIGFILIACSAYHAHHSPTGHTSVTWVIIGMILIGVAELFVDPVVTAKIVQLNPANSSGILMGIYMLVTGSFANYIASQLASLTDVQQSGTITTIERIHMADIYSVIFRNISITGIGITAGLIIFSMVIHRLLKLTASES